MVRTMIRSLNKLRHDPNPDRHEDSSTVDGTWHLYSGFYGLALEVHGACHRANARVCHRLSQFRAFLRQSITNRKRRSLKGRRELAYCFSSADPNLLQGSQAILGRGLRSIRDEEAPARTTCGGRGDQEVGRTTELDNVPTKIIHPGRFRKIRYEVPPRGRVEVRVEASTPVSIYIVEEPDLDRWRRGSEFNGLSYLSRTELHKELRLPFDPDEDWYLIIENESNDIAAVHYEVY